MPMPTMRMKIGKSPQKIRRLISKLLPLAGDQGYVRGFSAPFTHMSFFKLEPCHVS